MTKIVIAGAGFGGLNAALRLERKLKNKDASITLVDRSNYHAFSPCLYEVAASEEEMTSVDQLRSIVTVSIKKLLEGKKIDFIQGEIGFVDRQRRKVKVGIREVDYDYLVLATGSTPAYFGVKGAKEFALSLKSVSDAFRIRNALEFAVTSRRHDVIKQYVHFVVAGGGYTGVELVSEISRLADIIAWKSGYPREKIEITVLEAANQLLPGFDKAAGDMVHQRLLDLGVRVRLLSQVAEVDRHHVMLTGGDSLPYDVLIWTAGVRASEPKVLPDLIKNQYGQIETDEFLRTKNEAHIFAIGDIAAVIDKDGRSVPATAQAAEAESGYLADNFSGWLENKKPSRGFSLGSHPFIVSVGGKWAVLKLGKHYYSGYLPYLLRLFANWRYFRGLVGWRKALGKVFSQEKNFNRNN